MTLNIATSRLTYKYNGGDEIDLINTIFPDNNHPNLSRRLAVIKDGIVGHPLYDQMTTNVIWGRMAISKKSFRFKDSLVASNYRNVGHYYDLLTANIQNSHVDETPSTDFSYTPHADGTFTVITILNHSCYVLGKNMATINANGNSNDVYTVFTQYDIVDPAYKLYEIKMMEGVIIVFGVSTDATNGEYTHIVKLFGGLKGNKVSNSGASTEYDCITPSSFTFTSKHNYVDFPHYNVVVSSDTVSDNDYTYNSRNISITSGEHQTMTIGTYKVNGNVVESTGFIPTTTIESDYPFNIKGAGLGNMYLPKDYNSVMYYIDSGVLYYLSEDKYIPIRGLPTLSNIVKPLNISGNDVCIVQSLTRYFIVKGGMVSPITLSNARDINKLTWSVYDYIEITAEDSEGHYYTMKTRNTLYLKKNFTLKAIKNPYNI